MSEQKPTYEDIVAYCMEGGLIGKVDTVKFYDYYGKQNFMFRGQIMDWKNKLHEWASGQKSKIIQKAKEANAVASLSAKSKKANSGIDVGQLAYVQKVFGLA